MESFDVVVVGGRCAGSALATYLVRAGARVCMLDKAAFPSETPSTHVIQPCGVGVLAELGAMPSLRSAGAAELYDLTFVNDNVRIEARLPDDFGHPGLNARRAILDEALQNAARTAGVEVRNRCRVTGVRVHNGRVVGVETEHGPIGADLVVGADGRQSIIAESVGARSYLERQAGRMPVWGYFAAGPQEARLRIARIGDAAFLASPTDSGLYFACVAVDQDRADEFNSDREGNFRTALARWPELDDIVGGARRDGPLRVMRNWHSYFRESAGPGWVLVGDAGQFKDFHAGQGISDALCQARSLSRAICAPGPSSRDDALAQWWRRRDRGSYDMYWLATQMGRPGTSTPLTTEILRRVADDPGGGTTLLRVLNRELPSTALFTVPRLLSGSYAALRRHPNRRETLAEIGAEAAAEFAKQRYRLRSSLPVRNPPGRDRVSAGHSR